MANLELQGAINGKEYEKFGIENGLGWLIWYSVPKSAEEITYKQAREILERHGMNPDTFPPETPSKAYHATLEHFRDMNPSSPRRVMIRPIPTAVSSVTRHQVTIESIGKAQDENKNEIDGLEYVRNLFVQFHKSNHTVSFFKDAGAKMTQEERAWGIKFTQTFESIRTRVKKHDIQLYMFLRHTQHWNSVGVRDAGGIWFVSKEFTGEVKKMEAIMADFAHGIKFWKTPVIDITEWRENIAGAFDDQIEFELGQIQDELKKLLDGAKEKGGEIPKSQLERRLARFKTVTGRAEMYEKLLSYRAKKVRGNITGLETQVKNVLLGKVKGLVPMDSKAEQAEVARAERKAKRDADKLKKEKDAKKKPADAKKDAPKGKPARKSKKTEKPAPKSNGRAKKVDGVVVGGTPPPSKEAKRQAKPKPRRKPAKKSAKTPF